ncbi:hypothetical protein G6L37_34930 [Agrobacterium rubi]|nr:hypothetical protein [Agrobacterium rubi]NTF23764.1 hypothetical protein [Agrobacterium rubi]
MTRISRNIRGLVFTTAFAAIIATAPPSYAAGEFIYRYKMAGASETVQPSPPIIPPVLPPVVPTDDTKTDDGNGNLIITVTDLTPDDYYWDNLGVETKTFVDQAIIRQGRTPADVAPKFTVQGLVPGIGYNAFTGVVSGQPTTVGVHSLIVTAWDPDPDADDDDDQPWQKLVDIVYNIEVTPNLSPVRKIMNVASATQFNTSAFTSTYYDPGTPYAQSTDNFIGGFSIPDAAAAECATIDWSFTSSVPQALGLTSLAKNVVRIDGEPDYAYFDGGYANTKFWYYPVKTNAVCKDAVGAIKWNQRSPKFLLRVLAPA